jgi:hypothetical protein
MNFYLYFPCLDLLFNFSENRYKRFAYNAVDRVRFVKIGTINLYSFMGLDEVTFNLVP